MGGGGEGKVEGRNTACNIRPAPPIAHTCRQCVACREDGRLKLILFHNNSLEWFETWTERRKEKPFCQNILIPLYYSGIKGRAPSTIASEKFSLFQQAAEKLQPLAMPSG